MKKVKNVSKPKSQKHSIKKLPPGWIDEFFLFKKQKNYDQASTNQGDIIFALALSISTGLRPVELENGVTVHVNGDEVEIEIKGAKHSKNEFGISERGIEKRWITINPEYSRASQYIHDTSIEILKDSKHSCFTFSYDRDSLRKNVALTSKSYFKEYHPKKKPVPISPYSFRHMFAASLKSDEYLTNEQIAQALGHLSLESMHSYAKKFRRGTPKKPILKVRSSELPRSHQKPTPKITRLSPQSPSL